MGTMQKKVLIFDCQLLQTKAWHRGMGKYTARLLSAFTADSILTDQYESIVFLYNDKLAYSDELKVFAAANPKAEVKFLSLDNPIDGDQHAITVAQRTNRVVLDTYIDQTFPDNHVSFCITSLFLDEACPTFPTNTYNSVIFYDLIPLMYYRLYLGLGVSEQYFTRFSVLFAAHQLFAISETVANDLVTFLGIPKEKIINIRGASNHVAGERIATDPELAIDRPYVLMPTGGDPRKNNLNGVKGFHQFNKQNDHKYQLVITSIFTQEQKDELGMYSSDLLFTDNVSDHELWWLYENAQTVLFPTEYEGLGMPILEAIDAEKTIVCSDIPVFREISTTAFYMFDPSDPQAICSSLEEVMIASGADVARKKKQYPAISEQYTWKSTAQIVAGLVAGDIPATSVKKPKIALVTPNLCQPSEEARYGALQYAALANEFDVDFYYDISPHEHLVRPSYHAFTTLTHDIRQLNEESYSKYDLVVYLLGNSETSTATLQAALALPGLAVITDGALQDAYGGAVARRTMSQARADEEDERCLSTVIQKSIAITSVDSAISDITLRPQANELVYVAHKKRSLYNKVFINMDASRPDEEWNADFINDIAATVDKSKIMFTIVTRTKFSTDIFNKLSHASVTLYEDVSDHEYTTLLSGSDLYIDARPGASLNKMYPSSEAEMLGLTVYLNTVPGTIGFISPTTYYAADGADLRDMTYKWLVGAETPKRELITQRGESLESIINATIAKKLQERK